jgi:hypothetical protein
MAPLDYLSLTSIPSQIIPHELKSRITGIVVEKDTIVFHTVYSIKTPGDFVILVIELESILLRLFKERLPHHEVLVYSDHPTGKIFLKAIPKNDFCNTNRNLEFFLLFDKQPNKHEA